MILITGATGYVGGRLLRRLMQGGHQVRCLARRPDFLQARAGPDVDVVSGDVLDHASLEPAMRGVTAAYYLVHSMGSSGSFEQADREGARNFGEAARSAGVGRIIYLGGLGDDEEQLSPHLRSRHEVGDFLRQSGVRVVEFRASIVIGSGSLSFEMIRALVERLPVMIMPRWVRVPAQPIAIDDVLSYLVAALDIPLTEHTTIEIGGQDIVSYGGLMREYAHQRGLRRIMLPVPVLTPFLSSLWLGLVTPLFARVGRKLIQSIRYPTVVRDDSARRLFTIKPIGVREAIAQALRNEERELAESRWSDARSAAGKERQYGGVRFGNRLIDVRTLHVPVSPAAAFQPIQCIGGCTGWYYGNWLWTLRGWMDLIVGGVGLRGRRDPDTLHVGDVLDWWRVEALEPGRRLRLQAEMKLPGRAWLEFEVQPEETGARITQTASFDPIGLSGLLYWYGIWPIHELVFRGMVRGIGRAAKKQT